MTEFRITFPEMEASTRSRAASILSKDLESIPEVGEVQLEKERPDTLDAGTIISIVLAGPALVAAVHALHAWLVRENQTSLDITKPDGTIVKLRNGRGTDVESVARELGQ